MKNYKKVFIILIIAIWVLPFLAAWIFNDELILWAWIGSFILTCVCSDKID